MDEGFTENYEEVYNYELIEQVKLGKSFEEVAKIFGVSVERVREVIAKDSVLDVDK